MIACRNSYAALVMAPPAVDVRRRVEPIITCDLLRPVRPNLAVRVGKTPSKSILLTSALTGRRQSLSHDEGKDWVDHADLDYRRCADIARNWPNQRQHIVTNADLKSGKSRSAGELAVASAAQQTKVKRFADDAQATELNHALRGGS